jgi:hypothetical protein
MLDATENQIHDLLVEHEDTARVAVELVVRWNRNLLSEAEQVDVAQFLLRSGQWPALLSQCEKLLKDAKTLPWTFFTEVILELDLELSENEINALLEGAKAQDSLRCLATVAGAETWGDEIIEMRNAVWAERAQALEQRRSDLRDRLEYARNQRLFEEEERVHAEYEMVFPFDTELKSNKKSFEERRAREVISKGIRHEKTEIDFEENLAALPADQMAAQEDLIKSVKSRARANPKMAYDLALFLAFMDLPWEALGILRLHPDSPAVDWFALDLLLKSHRYLDALDEAGRLEIKYASESETTFAAIYARAQALWGLGQKTMAIDLMRSVVKVRPHYKSAHSLLLAWTGGEL